jgi:predicted TPR repeat methyltransferase
MHAAMTLKPIQQTTGDAIADRRFAYASAAFVDADWQAAADLAAQTIELTPAFAPAYALLGRAQAALGHRDEAIVAFNEALERDPEDTLGVRLDLAKLGALTPDEAISDGYVRALFDAYAERFDAHLTGPLAYRGPAVVMQSLERAMARAGRPVAFRLAIDLGCGTGLMGRALQKAARRMEGVDLSPRMVAEAAKTGLYARFDIAEAAEALDSRPAASADLIVAADVLVYVGDLFPLFREVARVLEPGGHFAFTCQAHLGPEDFVLGVDSRYQHNEFYLEAVAQDCGLDVADLASASTRQERGMDVPGFAMTLVKPALAKPA